MLSVPTYKIPRRVSIRVGKAEKLVLSKKDNKKKDNSKFRVVILGGKKKEASILVDDPSGNPEWNFSCVIKLPRGKSEPIGLLVEDSEGHHKGQVIIPLVQIGPKPYTYRPDQSPATSTNLICKELEPTNKCSTPNGFLIYWIWVEEYCTDGDVESRSSVTNSISAKFGSMNFLGPSKSRKSAMTGSVSNISSGMHLNKPESHKKTLSFLHIKSKKDKSKKSSSDFKITPDSSDVESNMEAGNPFVVDIKREKQPDASRNDSFGGSVSYTNPFNITVDPPEPAKTQVPDKLDVVSYGSHGSISESGSYNRFVDENQGVTKGIVPITLPPVTSFVPDNPPSIKQTNNAIPSTLVNKFNQANIPNPPLNQESRLNRVDSGSPHQEVDRRFQPNHKSNSGSDYSIFSDRNINQLPSNTMKIMNDEAESLRKENLELKTQHSKSINTISDLQNELDSVKDCLFKLRSRLLMEGATKFLEKI